MPRGPSFTSHSCIISQNRNSRKHDSLGEIIWLIGGEECSLRIRVLQRKGHTQTVLKQGHVWPFLLLWPGHMKFTQKFTQTYLHVLGWPKSSSEFFHNILQRTQMNFLANPQFFIYIFFIYIYFIYFFFHKGSFLSLNAQLVLRFHW